MRRNSDRRQAGSFGHSLCAKSPGGGMRHQKPACFRVENQIKPAIRRLIEPDFRATFPPPQRWLTKGRDYLCGPNTLQQGCRSRRAGSRAARRGISWWKRQGNMIRGRHPWAGRYAKSRQACPGVPQGMFQAQRSIIGLGFLAGRAKEQGRQKEGSKAGRPRCHNPKGQAPPLRRLWQRQPLAHQAPAQDSVVSTGRTGGDTGIGVPDGASEIISIRPES